MEELYDICILSVKHDAPTALRLAESIRTYRLPAGMKRSESGAGYRRITLDIEETPFTKETGNRLEQCRFLVLLCSPETKENPDILAKLACFRASHNNRNLIPVLVAQEPADSFPESLLERKKVQRILPDMSVVERVETIEPVAADLRPTTPSRWKQMLHYETVRIVASVLGLHPDDLEQRHRQRRKRSVQAALAMVGVVCALAAGIFLRLGLIARNEGLIAEEQTRLSVEIARRTMEELPEEFAGDEMALAYVQEAAANARSALRELNQEDLLSPAGSESGG